MVDGGIPALKPSSTRPRTVRRRWTDPDAQAVLKLRDQCPFMGKLHLKAMLDRTRVRLSVSTVAGQRLTFGVCSITFL